MDRVELVKRAFAAYREGNVGGAAALFAEHATWPAPDPSAPGCRDRRDIEAMMRRGKAFDVDGELDELVAVGDAVVVGFRPYRRGDEVSGPVVYRVLRFQGGLAFHAEGYPSLDAAMVAATDSRPGEVALRVRAGVNRAV
jgi:ketosteroid isomerase-like protein